MILLNEWLSAENFLWISIFIHSLNQARYQCLIIHILSFDTTLVLNRLDHVQLLSFLFHLLAFLLYLNITFVTCQLNFKQGQDIFEDHYMILFLGVCFIGNLQIKLVANQLSKINIWVVQVIKLETISFHYLLIFLFLLCEVLNLLLYLIYLI